MTKLIEFQNHKKETLRGLLDKGRGDSGTIFIHGFERTAVEKKFKKIVQRLRGKTNLFRFDFSGCGLSDGNFLDFNTGKLTKELQKAVAVFKKQCPNLKKLNLVAHSFGGCVALNFIKHNPKTINKLILLAPALNQKQLHRYWFAQIQNKEKEITWQNYQENFSEELFQKDIARKSRFTKENEISKEYFIDNSKIDYQNYLKQVKNFNNILIIHGERDEKVPPQSNNHLPQKIKILNILKGDHDLSRPDMMAQWIEEAVKFLI